MKLQLVSAGVLCAGAVVLANFLDDGAAPDLTAEPPAASRQAVPPKTVDLRVKQTPRALREVRLQSDGRGHHAGEFRLNGHRVRGLVDTGATAIGINRAVARRAGIRLLRGDFVHPVQTANGTVMAARARLDEVRIGSIRIRDVEAMVLDDDALNVVLIGMSFLRRLDSFAHEDGNLVLRQ